MLSPDLYGDTSNIDMMEIVVIIWSNLHNGFVKISHLIHKSETFKPDSKS